MKLAFTSIAAVAAALVAVAPASAVTQFVDLGTISTVPAFFSPGFSAPAGADIFNYNFVLTVATSVNASSFSSAPPPLAFTSAGIYAGTFTTTGPVGPSLAAAPSTMTSGGSNFISLAPTLLTAGTYTISVAGNAGGATSLGSSISFTAAPEPATWGLMVLGFGAIGGALRTSRRKVVFA